VVVALAAAYFIALVTTPAGVSGAVLLPPFQAAVLGTPSLAITPTNLVYNVVATPGALYRYWRQGQTGGRLALWLIAGTVPGVIAGSVIRVELLPGEDVFGLVIAAVLIPLGFWLALTRPPAADAPGRLAWEIPVPVLVALAAVVGCVGGIYGIGGGAILAPVLIGSGQRASMVAPAALTATFVTSVAGVTTFTLLSLYHPGAVAPDWPAGLALGAGGLAGSYTGARIQGRMPDVLIRRLVGILVIAIGAGYLWSAAFLCVYWLLPPRHCRGAFPRIGPGHIRAGWQAGRPAGLSRGFQQTYGLRPAAMNPRTAEKNVSASAARLSAAHQAAASSAVTWPDCTARSIVPWLSC
jgi:uncharacterized protein